MSEVVVELRDVFCVHRTNEGDAAALQGANLELGRGEVLCSPDWVSCCSFRHRRRIQTASGSTSCASSCAT